MTTTRLAIVFVVLVVGALAVAPGASAAIVGGLVDSTAESGDSEAETANDTTSMGAEVSTFMQASAADTDESVDARMFISAYENGDDETRERVVTDRTTHLEAKLTELEAEHDDLVDRKDSMNPAAYNAQLTRLVVQLDSLERAIDDTEPRAAEVGVDTEALEELRSNASNLSGPEVAAVATNIAGIDRPRGPPQAVSDRGNDSGPPGFGVGPQTNVTDQSGATAPGAGVEGVVGTGGNESSGEQQNQSVGQGQDQRHEQTNGSDGGEGLLVE